MSSTRAEILEQMFEDIKESNIFLSDFHSFKGEEDNLTHLGHMRTPILYAIDTGIERTDVVDSSGTRFSVQVLLIAVVKSTRRANLAEAINDALSAIKNLIASDPLTHATVRKWQYVSSESIDLAEYGMPNYARCGVETNLIYYATSGSY